MDVFGPVSIIHKSPEPQRIYTMTVEKVLIQGLHISTRVTEPDAVLTQFAVPVVNPPA